MLIGTINGEIARGHFLARLLEESGFVDTAMGFHMRRIAPLAMPESMAAAALNGGVDEDENDEDAIAEEPVAEEPSAEKENGEENDPEVPETA